MTVKGVRGDIIAGSNAYRARQAAPHGDCQIQNRRRAQPTGRALLSFSGPELAYRPPLADPLPAPIDNAGMIDLIIVAAASGLAGFVDAVVGGGGLVLIPALFATYPNAVPATLFGTNKGGAIWGTAWAAVQFARRVTLARVTMAWGMAGALAGSFFGAWVVTLVSAKPLKQALPFVLLAILVYTVAKKQLGRDHTPRMTGGAEAIAAGLIGMVIGFYDGFFGPGTGSFFVFLFVRILGYDFLHASAAAKRLNTATNFAALVLFAWTGHIWWHIAAVLAVANIIGSLLGTRLALARGAGFVRIVFIVVVSLLILKTAWDSFGATIVAAL